MPPTIMTLFTGRNVMWLDKVDSTNTYAAGFLKDADVAEGLVVAAYEQTNGRGQRGSSWQSVAGENLTFTLVLSPRFLSASDVFFLNQIVSLAVMNLVEELVPGTVQVKWPNDVLLNGKKVAGILIENNLSGDRISRSYVGVGLNVNQENFSGLPNATSLKLNSGNRFAIEKVLDQFCSLFEPVYLRLRSGAYESIARQYHQKLFGMGQERTFLMEGKELTARITGVDQEGKLCLETVRERICCSTKEISFVF